MTSGQHLKNWLESGVKALLRRGRSRKTPGQEVLLARRWASWLGAPGQDLLAKSPGQDLLARNYALNAPFNTRHQVPPVTTSGLGPSSTRPQAKCQSTGVSRRGLREINRQSKAGLSLPRDCLALYVKNSTSVYPREKYDPSNCIKISRGIHF